MRFSKTIQVPGHLEEFDLFWAIFATGRVSAGGVALKIIGSPMPSFQIVSDTTIRLTWDMGTIYVERDGCTIATKALTICNEALKPFLTTGCVDLFQTMLGTFQLKVTGDVRPVMRRLSNCIQITLPAGTATVDVPLWLADPEIEEVNVYQDRRVEIITSRGSLVKLEFT